MRAPYTRMRACRGRNGPYREKPSRKLSAVSAFAVGDSWNCVRLGPRGRPGLGALVEDTCRSGTNTAATTALRWHRRTAPAAIHFLSGPARISRPPTGLFTAAPVSAAQLRTHLTQKLSAPRALKRSSSASSRFQCRDPGVTITLPRPLLNDPVGNHSTFARLFDPPECRRLGRSELRR